MAKIYTDNDADLGVLQNKTLAVLGSAGKVALPRK
jgi:ketol-acid reductoisomerase